MILRLGILAIGILSSYIGSLSFQNSSPGDWALGAGALLIAILCFFFLAKGLWRIMGCFSTFLLMAVLVGVLFFFLSGFGTSILGGLTGFVKDKAASISQKQPATTAAAGQTPTPDDVVANAQPQPAVSQLIRGKVDSIAAGDLIRMGNLTIRIYGIASPKIDQTCADAHGRAYDCGYISARKLKDFIGSDEVTCRPMNMNAQGVLMGACKVGTFDIGAAMVEEGWAIALPNVTTVYLPYQKKAQDARNGMWSGTFKMPWEWEAQQQQIKEKKESIKIPKIKIPSKSKKKSIFDSF